MKRNAIKTICFLVLLLLLCLTGCGTDVETPSTVMQTPAQNPIIRDDEAPDWYVQSVSLDVKGLTDLCIDGAGFLLAAESGVYGLNEDLELTDEEPLDEDAILIYQESEGLLRLLCDEDGTGFVLQDETGIRCRFACDHWPDKAQLFVRDGEVWICDGRELLRNGVALELPTAPDGQWRAGAIVETSSGLEAILCKVGAETMTTGELRLFPLTVGTEGLDLREGVALPTGFISFPEPVCAAECGCIYSDGRLWRVEGERFTLLADLQALGVNPMRLRRVLVPTAGEVLCLLEDGLLLLTTEKSAPVPPQTDESSASEPSQSPVEKTTLRVGSLYSSFELTDLISYVNLHSDRIRLEAKEYDDIDALNRAILTGEVDVVESSDLELLRDYAKKELLVPLEEIAPEMFSSGVLYENLTDTLSVNGRCMYLPLYLEPSANVLPKDYELLQTAGNDAEAYFDLLTERDQELFSWSTQEITFGNWLSVTQDYWIDGITGETRFQSVEFLALLEYCNRFVHTEAEAAANQSAQATANDPHASCLFPISAKYTKLGDYVFTAPPFGNLSPCAMVCFGTLGIVNQNVDADAARALLETMFTDEGWHRKWKDGGFRSLCVSLNREWTESDLDAYADQQINVEHSGIEDVPAFLSGISEVRTLFREANHLYGGSSELRGVILEEANAFFNGDITAEEAARRIQNRVEIYLAEHG